MKQFQPLGSKLAASEERYPRKVATRLAKARNKAACYRIISSHENDWNGCGDGLGRLCRKTIADDYRHLAMDQISRETWQAIQVVIRPTILDYYVLALDESGLVQALADGDEICEWPGRRRAQESDGGYCLPLRSCGERRCQNAAGNTADECSTIHA